MDFFGFIYLAVLALLFFTRDGAVADTVAFSAALWIVTHPGSMDQISRMILGY